YDRNTGRITDLIMAGLVNYAGLDGMQPAALAALAATFNDPDHDDEELPMNKTLAALLAKLGLDAAKSTDEQALAALNAYIAKADAADGQVAALSAQVAAATPDPAKYMPVEAVAPLREQLAALTAQVNGGEIDKVVEAALSAGKLLPAQEKWARDLGKSDIAALKAYVESAPQIAALGGQQTQGKPPAGKEGELTAEQLAVCSAMGLSAEDFKKTLAEA
ncbi:MAG: phage protease, partial [Burkholderiaceae bacterium]